MTLSPPAFHLGTRHRVTWLLLAAASLWLRSGFPIDAIGDAGLDDALFVQLARSIGAGQWLGPVYNTTLVKGAAYPVFILAAFIAGIPLKLAEQGLYLAFSAALSLLVARTERRAWLGTLLFGVLAFNPTLWTVELSRVVREGIYISLSFGVVTLLAAAMAPGRLVTRMLLGLAAGLTAGLFWLTREEGVWLLPAAAACVAVRALALVPPRPWRTRFILAALRPAAAALLVAALAAAALVAGNVTLNRHVYGVAQTVEVKSPAFLHAYGALSRIQHRTWQRYVVFPQDARALAYAVSPAARELRPALEGAIGENWRQVSCEQQPGSDCTEILASWFQWALRDAVAKAGHYVTLTEAARFYAQLASEVDAACDRNDIPCLPPRATLAPPFRPEYLGDAARAALRLLPGLLEAGAPDVHSEPSTGPVGRLDVFQDTVGPIGTAPASTEIRGWVRGPGEPVQLALRTLPGPGRLDLGMELDVLAPSEAAAPDGVPAQTFLFSSSCPPARCVLLVRSGGQDRATIPLTSLQAPGRIEQGGVTLVVEDTNFFHHGLAGRATMIQRAARPIVRLYAVLTPALAVTGLLGTLLALPILRAAALRSILFALAVASAVAILCRLALVAYLDVTSIRAVGLIYLTAATPFVLVLACAGTVLLVRCTAAAWGRRSAPAGLPRIAEDR